MGLTYSLCVLDLFPLKPTSPDVILLGSTKQRYSHFYIKEPPVLVYTVTALLYFKLYVMLLCKMTMRTTLISSDMFKNVYLNRAETLFY